MFFAGSKTTHFSSFVGQESLSNGVPDPAFSGNGHSGRDIIVAVYFVAVLSFVIEKCCVVFQTSIVQWDGQCSGDGFFQGVVEY